MALKKCVECNSLMSDKAPICINCGYPIAFSKLSSDQAHGMADQQPGKPDSTGRLRELAIYGTFVSVLFLVGISISGL
jgi:hypothetical protein